MSVIDPVQAPSLPNTPAGPQPQVPQVPANPEPQAPLNPDLAGYPTQEALVQGYRDSGAEAVRQRERADELAAWTGNQEEGCDRGSAAAGVAPTGSASGWGLPYSAVMR